MEILSLQEEIISKLKKDCYVQIQNMVKDQSKYEAFLNSSLYQVSFFSSDEK